MISRKVDLTENGDFSVGNVIEEMDMTIIDRWYDGSSMSVDEYDFAVWWEGIFGKIRHTNEKRKLFKDVENNRILKFEKSTHCERCGKELRMPWNRLNGYCPECNHELNRTVPWKAWKAEVSHRRIEDASDVFNLR